MNKSRISRILLRLGVLGAFLYGSVVSLGSFILYGCLCQDSPSQYKTPPSEQPPKPIESNQDPLPKG